MQASSPPQVTSEPVSTYSLKNYLRFRVKGLRMETGSIRGSKCMLKNHKTPMNPKNPFP